MILATLAGHKAFASLSAEYVTRFAMTAFSLYFHPFRNTRRCTCKFLWEYLQETFLLKSDEISLSKSKKAIDRTDDR